MVLNFGDFTLQKTFNLVQFSNDGARVTAGFKPDKGHEFVTLLVGQAKKGEKVDVDKMMARLGLVCDDKGAKEILMLKAEIDQLKQKLAAALAGKAA